MHNSINAERNMELRICEFLFSILPVIIIENIKVARRTEGDKPVMKAKKRSTDILTHKPNFFPQVYRLSGLNKTIKNI